MCFHVDKWSTGDWFFTNNNTSSLSESLINWAYGIIWCLDFAQEDWLLESWARSKLTSIVYSPCSWDDLTTSSMDGIGVEDDILDVDSHSSHALFAHYTFFGGSLECSFHGVLDFVQELDTLGSINEHVWSSVVWSEGPNLLGIGLVPFKLINKNL